MLSLVSPVVALAPPALAGLDLLDLLGALPAAACFLAGFALLATRGRVTVTRRAERARPGLVSPQQGARIAAFLVDATAAMLLLAGAVTLTVWVAVGPLSGPRGEPVRSCATDPGTTTCAPPSTRPGGPSPFSRPSRPFR